MVKKLYITGAGASKDLNQNNLLGCELLEQIKNHRFYIYYWLIAMVVVRVAKNLFPDESFILRAADVADIIASFLKENKKNTSFASSLEAPTSIKAFINKLSKEGFIRINDVNKRSSISQKSIEYLLDEGIIFKQKFTNLEDQKYFQTAIYHITNFYINQFYKYENYKGKGMIQPDEFKSALDFILNYIFEDDCKSTVKNLKKQVICGIALSFIVQDFNSDSNSIDNIINFLESLSFYNDDYAKKYRLPKIEEIKNFAVLLVQDLIGVAAGHCYGAGSKDYREHLYTSFFSKKLEELKFIDENIEFINFNYDPSLFRYFYQKLNGDIGSQDRKQALEKLKEKIEQSHIYGKISVTYLTNKDSCSYLPFFANYFSFIFDKEKPKIRQEEISLIRTKPTEAQIKNNFEKIKNSDEIYILGFGFDEYNLQNIGISASDTKNLEEVKNKTVYATNHGDLPRIRLTLERIFAVKLYKESELQEGDKKHSFWRSRDDATINKRNNNVFVSTKPVYRALSEDFLA